MEKRDNILQSRVDENIRNQIKNIAENSKDLNLTKEEIVKLILLVFFKTQGENAQAKVREICIKHRTGLM